MSYDHRIIEKKWQEIWEKSKAYEANMYDFSRPKFYALDMFPYPSAEGLHVGHPRGYTATDVISRYKRLKGFNVLHPIGWDSFGLPAEQHAIKTNTHPRIQTDKNIANFTRQLKALGFSYDWSKELATSNDNYIKWTQWIFTKLYEKGLAYEADLPVNWCPELGTVLANEEVIDGKSEVGGFPVIRKKIRQWVLKITDYAEKLSDDLEELDWPASTKTMQRNWIGKSEGVEIDFPIVSHQDKVRVFTTRVDTLYGCTYLVLAPDHPLVKKIATIDLSLVDKLIKDNENKSDMDRELEKDKVGLFIGAYGINPVNNKKIPIYVADYVLSGYGSGAVMAVPAHDQRDYQFAKKYNLEIIQVLEGDIENAAYIEDGKHINSDIANGLNIEDAKKKITDYLIQKGYGQIKVNYKLRDWIFSRQRYWGEPIPIIHLDDGSKIIETNLPLTLPALSDFKPSKDGSAPLAKAEDWVNVKVNGKNGHRETNTMPQWAGSCWYYLRYLDPNNADKIAEKKLLDFWLPVDLYIGGAEHAVLHLLYARFWHKVLYDIGLVSHKEPFKKLFHQGMILGENGEKMSKSRGNVINPDEIINELGADSLRLYEMFLGPLDSYLPWSTNNLQGSRRFLERVYRLITEDEYKTRVKAKREDKLEVARHKMVKKVTEDIENLRFNTAISALMTFVNDLYKSEKIYRNDLVDLLLLLFPFAPHLTSELLKIHFDLEVKDCQWPSFDEEKTQSDIISLPVQINGKVRGLLEVESTIEQEELLQLISNHPNFQKHLEDKKIQKVIFIPGRIINIIC